MSKTNPLPQEELKLELQPEVLQQMLEEKSKENIKLQELLNSAKEETLTIKTRALNVHEKNRLYEADPELAAEMARMEFQMNLADRFIKSGAFKAANKEQAFVVIKSGAEMGMKPVEAMQALYCVNGSVRFYGDKMLARITKAGYKTEYLNETAKGVDVRVFHPSEDIDFDVTETVKDTDQILQRSKAAGFAKKNKMRFHGIRMIASFHLPHLFGSVADEFSNDFHEYELLPEGNTKLHISDETLLQQIQDCKTLESLEELYLEHKAEISRDIHLASALGKAKKVFQTKKPVDHEE